MAQRRDDFWGGAPVNILPDHKLTLGFHNVNIPREMVEFLSAIKISVFIQNHCA